MTRLLRGAEGYATTPNAVIRLAGGIGNLDGRYTIANVLERIENAAL